MTVNSTGVIGIIGGSGLYQIDGLANITEHRVETPFGPPSDVIIGGQLTGRQVFFLPRHARGHRIRCRCFIADRRRIIMPAFGSYTGALSVPSGPAYRMLISPDARCSCITSARPSPL